MTTTNSAEPVEHDGNSCSADGGNLGGTGSGERPPRSSDADVQVARGTRPGDPAPAALNDGFCQEPFHLGNKKQASLAALGAATPVYSWIHDPPARMLAVRQCLMRTDTTTDTV